MLPRDTAKVTITLYNFWSPDDGLFSYKRTILEDCIWRLVEEADNINQGLKIPETVKIIIPYSYEYFSVQNGEIYEGKGWTIQIGPELIGSYILKGEHSFEFPIISKDDLLKLHVLSFEKQFLPRRPTRIVENFWGSRGLWQVEARC